MTREHDFTKSLQHAAQGIGRATAELFGREGSRVVLVDIDEALVQKSAQELAGLGGAETLGLRADVTSYESCEAAVKAAREQAKQQVADAMAFARASAYPESYEAFQHVFAE
jgi:NAD(P)-dependent dehydrogenase (short-subunit alcohol dehydrogenase family)